MGVTVDCAQCQRNACGVHWRPRTAYSDGGQIQSIRQILVDIEEPSIVEVLLGHGTPSQVGFDASEGRKGLFPSCSGNGALWDRSSPACLPQSLNMLEASGAAASMFATVRTLVTLEAMSAIGQLFRLRRSDSTRSCLSSFLMSMSLLYKSWISGGVSGAPSAAASAKATTSHEPKPGDSGSLIG